MTQLISEFLIALDKKLEPFASPGERLDLYHLGRSALVLHYAMAVSTKDFDVVAMQRPLEVKAVELFGQTSDSATRFGLYLETVPQGLPPLPQDFVNRCTEVAGPWRIIRLWRLEPHDLAATKLKSFRVGDREDLRFLCDQGLIHADQLRRSLESAFLWSTEGEDDPERERAFTNLRKVIDYMEGRAGAL
jgi:hypothetical protein